MKLDKIGETYNLYRVNQCNVVTGYIYVRENNISLFASKRTVLFPFIHEFPSFPSLSFSFPFLPFLSSFRLNSPPCSISSTLRSKVFYEYKNWIYILIQATRILFPLFLSCILPLPRFFTLALHRPFVSLSPF